MRNHNSILLLGFCFAITVSPVCAQQPDSKMESKVIEGPATASLGGVAQIEVPAGFRFVDGETLRRFMKALGEPGYDNLLGRLSPVDENVHWAVYFSFDDIGYVKDDDKDKLNADKLLEDYRRGTEAANKIRAKSGKSPIHVVGWEIPPRYNDSSHNLEWAIRGTCDGEEILNFDTRLLGRKGVMEVTLAVDPAEFTRTLPAYTNLMAGYSFQSGQTYAEYRKGDKVAKYGLAALITAGAAVGAAKLGLFAWLAVLLKKFYKLIVVAVIAVAAFFKKIVSALLGRRGEIPPRS